MNEQVVNNADIESGLLGALIGGGTSIVGVVFLIIMIVSGWKIFSKAGQPGWASIVPIYNIIVALKIVRQPLWVVLLIFVPIVNGLVSIWLTWELGKAFDKGAGFRIGLILLPFIFFPILAFGDSQYAYGAQSSGPNTNPGEPTGY